MMKRFTDNLIPFVCGVVSTLLAFGFLADVHAQKSSNEVVDTCASPDGTLRLIAPFGTCQPGERRVRLREPKLEEEKEQKPEEQKHLLDLDRRLKDLEERAKGGRLLGSRVYAPFEVVNEAGYVVFHVEDGVVRFNNAVGTGVARIVMNELGGYLEARSATADLQTVIGTSGDTANVFLIEGERRRINLGRNDKGQYALRVYEPGGKLVAGIGQGTAGDGVVTVSDMEGTQRAAMYVHQTGGGVLDIINKQGTTVASVWATENGNGMMQLYNRDGVTMVEAGTNENNRGVVRAGPAGFHPGVGILGLPGSFIVGDGE
jgi:hypothetical protein